MKQLNKTLTESNQKLQKEIDKNKSSKKQPEQKQIVTQLKKANKDLERAKKDLEKSLEETKKQKQELEEENDALDTELKKAQERKQKENRKHPKSRKKNNNPLPKKVQKRISTLESNLQKERLKNTEFKGQINGFQTTIKELNSQLQSSLSESTTLKQQVEEMENVRKERTAIAEQLEELRKQLTDQKSDEMKRIDEKAGSKPDLTKQIEELKETDKTNKHKLQEYQAKVDELVHQLKESDMKVEDLQRRCEDRLGPEEDLITGPSKQVLQRRIEDLQTSKEAIAAQYEWMRQDNQRFQHAEAEANAKIADYRRQLDVLVSEMVGLRREREHLLSEKQELLMRLERMMKVQEFSSDTTTLNRNLAVKYYSYIR